MAEAKKPGWARRWGEALAAVLLGNVIYFALGPYLPPGLRHEPFQLDAGMAMDFAFCVLAYVAVRWISVAWSLRSGS